jgi:hypothetical protein
MAYAFVQQVETDYHTNGDGQTTIASGNMAAGITAGNLLVAFVWYIEPGSQTVTLSGGGSPTWVGETELVSSTWRMKVFYALNVPGAVQASSSITATFGAQVTYPGIWIAEFSGFKTSAARLAFISQNQTNPGTGANDVTSGLLGTLSAQPAGIIGFTLNTNNDASPTAGTSPTAFTATTAGWDYGATNGGRLEHARVTATTSVAATFGSSTGGAAIMQTVAWAFEEASGGGDPPITDGPKLVSVRSNIRFN